MKKMLLLIFLAGLILGCGRPKQKVDFNESAQLEQPAKNPDNKELKCGDTFTANFSNTDATFGSLEVINKGVCNVKVLVSEFVGGVGGAATKVAEFEVGAGVGNLTAFPLSTNKKFQLRFSCDPSTATGGCVFAYRFSTGKESANATRESPEIDSSPTLTPQGPSTGNLCITQAGKEAIGKVFTNNTAGEMKVTFTARSTCKCNPFTVFAEPSDGGNKQANAPAPTGTDTGVAIVPAGKTVTLKAKCGPGSLATEKCSGVVENIRISISLP
jgi:hypothetical protein